MLGVPENSGANQEQDDDRIVNRDETDPYNEVIFGRRRPDSVAIEWTGKTVYVLEFKRTLDQRQDYREQGERRARVQHDVLVRSLDTVAKEAEGESAGWTVKRNINIATDGTISAVIPTISTASTFSVGGIKVDGIIHTINNNT